MVSAAAAIYRCVRPKRQQLVYHPEARWGLYWCNYCSWFPEGPWEKGCQQHDLDYHNGGGPEERLDADRLLREHFRAVGWPNLGQVVYVAIRAVGSSQFRWNESVLVRSEVVLGKIDHLIDWAELARVRAMPAYLERWDVDNLETYLVSKTPYGLYVPATRVC